MASDDLVITNNRQTGGDGDWGLIDLGVEPRVMGLACFGHA
jgi:hypothetical protein